MTDFRFPHPFENIESAIKDAIDPDAPTDGSLVTQLMNENNRAVEDALQGLTTEINDHLHVYDIYTDADAEDPPYTTFAAGLWLMRATLRLEFIADGDFVYKPELSWTPNADGSPRNTVGTSVRAQTGDNLRFQFTCIETYRQSSSFQARPFCTPDSGGVYDIFDIGISCERLHGPDGLVDATP